MKFSRKTFFDGYRVAFGPLDQGQVTGLEFLLGAVEKDTTWKDVQQVAYLFATIKHETANTFQPIKEFRARAGTKARANQDRYWLTGFYGRGYIQLTWESNYEKFGIKSNPEKALEPETAFRIASRGMQQGLFTGKKLSDFIKGGKADYLHARQIINGMDKAKAIANIAEAFERILTTANFIIDPPRAEKPKTEPKPELVEADDKGVTTSPDKPESEVAGTPPPAPAAEVKASSPSWWGRLTTVSIPAGVLTVLAGVGKFLVHIPPYVWAVLGSVSIITAAWLWNQSLNRAHQRTLKVMDAAADKDKNNLRLI